MGAWFCQRILPMDSASGFCQWVLPMNSASGFRQWILPADSAHGFLPVDSARGFCPWILPGDCRWQSRQYPIQLAQSNLSRKYGYATFYVPRNDMDVSFHMYSIETSLVANEILSSGLEVVDRRQDRLVNTYPKPERAVWAAPGGGVAAREDDDKACHPRPDSGMLCQRIPTPKAPLPAYSLTWELPALPWCHWILVLRSITVGTFSDLVAATRHTANWRDEGGVNTRPRNDVE